MDPVNVSLPDTQDLATELARQDTRQEQLSGMLQNITAQLLAAASPPVAMGIPSLHLPLPP